MKKPDKSLLVPVERMMQVPVADKPRLMPITNMTEQDAGAAFVVGLGGTAGEQQIQSERAPSTIVPRIQSKGGGKSKRM